MDLDIVEKEFQHKAIIRGGIQLFKPCDAIEVIRRCRELKRRILGIDAFKITETTTKPLMNENIDYSNFETSKGFWSDAEKFIQERVNKDLVFEIVYE